MLYAAATDRFGSRSQMTFLIGGAHHGHGRTVFPYLAASISQGALGN